jgi:uncharacterized protein (TIGR03086 family)
MAQHLLAAKVAGPTLEVIRNLKADQLDAPTPCSEYDLRALVNHLLFWAPSLAGAARKQVVEPPAASESAVDLTAGDWAGTLARRVEEIVAAWSESGAWEGTTQMGGPTRLPASMIGEMMLGELVVHGWDMGIATGQRPTWDDDVLAVVHRGIEQTADQGRQMNIYGPEVPVAPTAPVLDRLLGLSGRDPRWTA